MPVHPEVDIPLDEAQHLSPLHAILLRGGGHAVSLREYIGPTLDAKYIHVPRNPSIVPPLAPAQFFERFQLSQQLTIVREDKRRRRCVRRLETKVLLSYRSLYKSLLLF